ncbi:hypothetical protein [uncultured Flavobacterium sp.]|uniref:hypothetical protein n=1 Tax=uncultured Flavobacterium sp. TaxID=165435 RepID=UPI0025EF7FF8|nr:hypothetical protein [uncultured Flavobacterium sp.]
MKIIFSGVVFILLVSCASKQVDSVKLEVLNTEVYYSGNSDEYRYKSEKSRKNSQNIITYRLINNTKENLAFIVNSDEIYPSVELMKDIDGISFNINDETNKSITFSNPLVTFIEDKCTGCNLEYFVYKDSIRSEKERLIGFKETYNWSQIDKYVKGIFILHSGESKTFKTIINFPIIKEINSSFGKIPIYYENLTENHNMVLYYGSDSKLLEEILPEYLMEDLKNNNTKLFNGIITAKALQFVEKK